MCVTAGMVGDAPQIVNPIPPASGFERVPATGECRVPGGCRLGQASASGISVGSWVVTNVASRRTTATLRRQVGSKSPVERLICARNSIAAVG